MEAKHSRKLHITLKRHWFQMTLSGEKPEEYREIKRFWIVRLCKKEYHRWDVRKIINAYKSGVEIFRNDLRIIAARNGYRADAPLWERELVSIRIGQGKAACGAPSEKHFILTLGKLL